LLIEHTSASGGLQKAVARAGVDAVRAIQISTSRADVEATAYPTRTSRLREDGDSRIEAVLIQRTSTSSTAPPRDEEIRAK